MIHFLHWPNCKNVKQLTIPRDDYYKNCQISREKYVLDLDKYSTFVDFDVVGHGHIYDPQRALKTTHLDIEFIHLSLSQLIGEEITGEFEELSALM